MDEAKRSVDRTPQDFLAAWWRGKAGPVPCAGCSACCYYPGIPVDEKRDRSRLPHLLTERNHDGELVLQRCADGACAHLARMLDPATPSHSLGEMLGLGKVAAKAGFPDPRGRFLMIRFNSL